MANTGGYNICTTKLEKEIVRMAIFTACRLIAERGWTLDEAVKLACPNSWSEFRGCVRAFLSGESMDFNDADLNAAQMADVFRMLYRRDAHTEALKRAAHSERNTTAIFWRAVADLLRRRWFSRWRG